MTKDDKIKVLERSIDELRRMHDEVNESYSHARVKIITFLGGAFALLTYLYGDGSLFIPPEVYGVIFYFIGVLLCLSSISILFFAIQAVKWMIPTERKVHKKLKFDNYIEFLEYSRDEYVDALNINMAHCERKLTYLNLAVFQLIIGAIVLLIIKNFS